MSRLLLAAVAGWHPRDTLAACDMTNTLLTQEPGGFSAALRELLQEFLQLGGTLAVVTGDSLAVVRSVFLEPLGPPRGELLVATSGGWRIDRVQPTGELDLLHQGAPLTPDERATLVACAEAAFVTVLGPAAGTWPTAPFAAPEGVRLDVAHLFPSLGGIAYTETAPNKVTLYFPATPEASGLAALILDTYAAAARVCGIAEVVRGPNFTDVLRDGEKGAALTRLLDLAPDWRRKHVALVGDSINDAGLLLHPCPDSARVVRIFVGRDASFLGAPPALFHLDRAYVAGTLSLFSALVTPWRNVP